MDRSEITLTVSESEVKGSVGWNGDDTSDVAILMDGDNGEKVWLRSRDWATYARFYGSERVALIVPDNNDTTTNNNNDK